MSTKTILSCLLIYSLILSDSHLMAQDEQPNNSVKASPACRVPEYSTPPLVGRGGIYPRCDGGTDPVALTALTDGSGECVCYKGSVNVWVNACVLVSRSKLTEIDNAVYCPGF